MEIKSFNTNTDYNDVSSWWKAQDWPILPESILSDCGFIIKDNNLKIAATWVFKTNSPIYIMEWTVGNPEVSWEKRQEGIQLLTEAASSWSKEHGASYLLTMTKSKRFIEKLKDSGFKETDDEMVHLMRSL